MSEKYRPSIVREKQKPERDLSEVMQDYQKLVSIQGELSPRWKEKISIHIDTPHPYFAFTPISDMHLGHKGVDLEALHDYLDFIGSGMTKTVLVGDLVDGFSPTAIPDGMMGDVFVPQVQLELTQKLIKRYEEHILGVVNTPSHDGWARKKSGLDLLAMAVQGTSVPLMKNGCLLDLTVNGQRYLIKLYHKIDKYNSSLNRLNAHHRVRELEDNVDVVIGAHRHIGAMEKSVHRKDRPYFVQLGTFKTEDSYGEAEGMFPKPQVFFPTLLFDTRKHNVEAIEDLSLSRYFCETMEKDLQIRAIASIHRARKRKLDQ